MKRVLLMIAVFAAGVPAAATAQEAAAPAPTAAPTTGAASGEGGEAVQFQKKTSYDFDDDLVEGDLVRPDGEFIDARRAIKQSSLIKIRDNFVAEMLKSAEDI